MSKTESEQTLPGWKQSFPSVWIRIRSGSCTEELCDLRETQQKVPSLFLVSTAVPAFIPIFLWPAFSWWSLLKQRRAEENLRMNCRL